jgi:integrase
MATRSLLRKLIPRPYSPAASLPRVRFHDLRHARATHLLASGVHPKIASERLGCSKVGITLGLY